MLEIRLDDAAIIEVQKGHREQGTRAGAIMASRIMALHKMFQERIRRFGERQAAAKKSGASTLLPDGKRATLAELVMGDEAPLGYPRLAGAILHGLHMASCTPLPRLSIRNGATQAPGAVDPETYIFRLDDGPARERSLGDMTALGVYFDPLELMLILWIGPETGFADAWESLSVETDRFCDWTRKHPVFAASLAALGA